MKIEPTPPIAATSDPTSKKVAEGLERAFLSEMLKFAGPRAMEGSFSGGMGKSQFASMLNDAYADALSKRIDLGFNKKIGGAA